MAATEPIRDKKQLRALAEYFRSRGQWRNHALVVLGACTALRISDLLRLTWEDVYDFEESRFRSHVLLTEQKTGKSKRIALSRQALYALRLLFPQRRSPYLFAGNRRDGRPISRVQAWRILRTGTRAVGIQGKIGCHGLRKSWGYHAWSSGQVSPVVIMEIYNHSSYQITKRYLGVAQDALDQAYLSLALFQ